MFDLIASHDHAVTCFAPEMHHDPPLPTAFTSDPTATEKVIFLPGGKTMVVDWGIQSFVKNVVSVAIAGVVVLGATAYGIVWVDKKLKQRKQVAQQVRIGPRKPPTPDDDYVNSSDESGEESE